MQKIKPRQKIRVLALDGGPSVTTYIYYLKHIIKKRPDFLSKIDVIAGTSDGAFVGMYLATRRPEQLARESAVATSHAMLDFCKEIFKRYQPWPSKLGHLRLAWGKGTYSTAAGIKLFLDEEYGGRTDSGSSGASTLEGLPSGKLVLFPTYKMTTPAGVVLQANFGEQGVSEVSRSDAVLRSASFPVLFPLANGHLDGGVFANNPSMCALTQILSQRDPDIRPEDIVVFSLGADTTSWGKETDALAGEDQAQWGWSQWLFGGNSPLRFLLATRPKPEKLKGSGEDDEDAAPAEEASDKVVAAGEEEKKMPRTLVKSLLKRARNTWNLEAKDFLLLGAMLLDAQQRAASIQMASLIRDRYFRLGVKPHGGVANLLMMYLLVDHEAMFIDGKKAKYGWDHAESLKWLDRHWLSD